jgi:simple sugar transport system permease protein
VRRALSRNVPLAATAAVFVLLYAVCALRYEGFFSWYQLAALVSDNATLGIAALGMSFVVLCGGIDLSVGAVLALASMLFALLVARASAPWWLAAPCVLLGGLAFGSGMGALIARWRLPPFIVTLAGMFLARGLALVLSEEKRVAVPGEAVRALLAPLAQRELTLPALAFLGATALASILARSTRFGRGVHAVGGSESAARSMGVRVGSTQVGVYALSGLCASAAGVLQVIGTGAGDASVGFALELDAIAAVVIGGTLLSGGSGHVLGTFLGVLILGVIATIPSYQGDLSSWWIRIGIGALLLAAILLQRLLEARLGPR